MSAVPAWQLILRVARDLSAQSSEFSRSELIDGVRRIDPSRQPGSLGPVIQGITTPAGRRQLALSTGQRSIRIGTADRPAYGQTRRRLVVWVGGEPVAEAVGIDEYGTNRQLASLLKDSAGQMIAADGAIPAPYASFAFLPFREVVSGPYARVVLERYDGDASSIWRDEPRAVELNARLRRFPGIGQKKAAMAVEILHRDLGVKIRDLSGSDIAYDVHVRRVFLRTRLAEVDDLDHMVEVARWLHPERPGELDYPAWLIGRRWCGPGTPDCGGCPLASVCPQDIQRAGRI